MINIRKNDNEVDSFKTRLIKDIISRLILNIPLFYLIYIYSQNYHILLNGLYILFIIFYSTNYQKYFILGISINNNKLNLDLKRWNNLKHYTFSICQVDLEYSESAGKIRTGILNFKYKSFYIPIQKNTNKWSKDELKNLSLEFKKIKKELCDGKNPKIKE